MTWSPSETPRDIAEQGDSLVASMLRQCSSQPSPNDLQVGSSEPEPTTEESSAHQPLWLAMHAAYCGGDSSIDPGDGPRYAAEIELVRDRMVSPSWPMAALFDALTYEARIAREAGQ